MGFEKQRSVLVVVLGILGTILLVAYILILLDSYVLPSKDNSFDDGEDEDCEYFSGQLLQSTRKLENNNNMKTTKTNINITPPTPQEDQATTTTSSEGDLEEGEENAGQQEGTTTTTENKTSTGRVFTRFEGVTWNRFLFLSFLVSIPTIIYITFFTTLGLGENTFHWAFDNFGDHAGMVGGITVGLATILYLLDANFWQNRWVFRICCAAVGFGAILTALLLTGKFPYGPICCFAIVTPFWLLGCNQVTFCSKERTTNLDYVSSLGGPLFFVSVLVAVTFLIWAFSSEHLEYDQATRTAAAQRFCKANLKDNPECAIGSDEDLDVCFVVNVTWTDRDISDPDEGCPESCIDKVYAHCPHAFLLWAEPLLVSLVLFFLSFFCTLIKGADPAKSIVNFGKLWLFLLFTMWLTAALAGVAAGFSKAMMAMTMASLIGSVVLACSTRTTSESKDEGWRLWGKIDENYGAYMDWARGLFLVFCTPLVFLYLILSILNQAVRKLGLPCSKSLKTPQQRADFVTKRTRNQINAFLSWDRAKVLTYAVYWGIGFIILLVFVEQFTVLFLSWLVEFTSTGEGMSLGLVTAILVFVGIVMFMLPPVPGLPIYLTMGIVIPVVGDMAKGWAVTYAAGVAFALKLLACAIQQKMIGELLAGYTSVRKLVQINSTQIKAMRLILAKPGMGIDKVSILVGGPDWPTSVLCGIMGLDLLPILIGTIPVFLLVAPTVIAGSLMQFAGVENEGGELKYPYAAVLVPVFTSIAALVQLSAGVFAAHYLEQTITNRKQELDSVPIDTEVAELEEHESELNSCYEVVTQWPDVPTGFKMILYAAFTLIVLSFYAVMLFPDKCFEEYELTDTINIDLPSGKWYNIVRPLGWVAILLFFMSCLLLYIFVAWATVKAKAARDVQLQKRLVGADDIVPEQDHKDGETDKNLTTTLSMPI